LVGAHYSLFAIQKRRLQINANLQCAITAGAQRNCDRMISNEDYSITISVGVSVERHIYSHISEFRAMFSMEKSCILFRLPEDSSENGLYF
jgi:hypothetical protein